MNKIGKITLSALPKNKLSDLLNDCKADKGESLPLKSGLKVATSLFRIRDNRKVKYTSYSLQQGRFCFVNHANVPVQNQVIMFLSCIFKSELKRYAINKDHLESAIIVFSARSLTKSNYINSWVHYKRVL